MHGRQKTPSPLNGGTSREPPLGASRQRSGGGVSLRPNPRGRPPVACGALDVAHKPCVSMAYFLYSACSVADLHCIQQFFFWTKKNVIWHGRSHCSWVRRCNMSLPACQVHSSDT